MQKTNTYLFKEGLATNMIETKRIILRRMTEDDTDQLLLIFTDPRVMASFDGLLFDRTKMEAWVRRNLEHQIKYGYGLFSVFLKNEGILIGDCGLEHMDVDGKTEGELGYDIRSDYWRKGYATEAASAVREYAFTVIGLNRLISLIRPSNIASIRVAEKTGMIKEQSIKRSGHVYYIYSIVPELI